MFIRKKENKSGSRTVQLIQKVNGRNKILKIMGCAVEQQEINKLVLLAKEEMKKIKKQGELLFTKEDSFVESFISSLSNFNVKTIGPELIFGRIYDSIGFNAIKEDLFRHLVISRLAFPLSKLKTVDYLYRYQGLDISIDSIYRFMDKLNESLKLQVEQIAYLNTLKVLQGNISVVFYDMTTLYFEASDEDDLRKIGFSKDGKDKKPQIVIGLLVGLGGYAIGYDIYEGNTYEGHTLIPFLEKVINKFNIDKPIVVADAGILSKSNILALETQGYEYIIGARLKNQPEIIKSKITGNDYKNKGTISINTDSKTRLIVNYSNKRASKDAYNRKRGLNRLEKQIKRGVLTKSNVNNRGYNKYLKMTGEIKIEIDYDKYLSDNVWDGLKGYITNTKLSDSEVIDNYKNLWHIEKAFRISKTDLRIRPIYHRLRKRIEAHICITFTAYCIYKELERVLYLENSTLSLEKASELTHNMYQITYRLPESRTTKKKILKMDKEQDELCQIISKYF